MGQELYRQVERDFSRLALETAPIIKNKINCAISSRDFYKILADAGVLPPLCKRAVITLDINSVVTIETECLADERILSVDVSGLVERKT